MKTVGASLKTHYAGEVTTIATCWRITRVDGVEFFFTDHDIDLVIDGDTYEAASGMLPTASSHTRTLSVDNMEVSAFVTSDKITVDDIKANLFDYATVDVFQVNHQDLSMGKLWLAQGWKIGNIETRRSAFQAEMRSKSQQLQQDIVELTRPTCRATLGDGRCGIDLNNSAGDFRHEGAVTSVTTATRKFIDTSVISSAISTDVFRYGKVLWSSPISTDSYTGDNATYEMEIKKFDPVTGEFELFLPMPNDIQVGDEFTAFWGCGGTRDECRDIYDNIPNMRAEPFLPGWDRLLDVGTL